MDELVARLSEGAHPVSLPQDMSLDELRKRIDEFGLVFITFTETRGGTTLGIRIDPHRSDGTADADFERGTGTVHLEGTLRLNYIPVRCVSDIDLAQRAGMARLVVLDQSEA